MATTLTQERIPSYAQTGSWAVEQPNALVRFAFYFALFAIPFGRIYLPGTGERLGVTRIAQIFILFAALSQPRICIRKVPVALVFFILYCLLRIGMGYGLTPNLSSFWWHTTFDLMQTLFVFWFLFNVLQQKGMGSRGLWFFVAGAAACAALHLLDIGTIHLPPSAETRISIFGENANVAATTYSVALVAAMGMLIHLRTQNSTTWMLLPVIAIIGAGVALTGSRTGALIAIVGLLILILPLKPVGLRPKPIILFLVIASIFAAVLHRFPVIAQRAGQSMASHGDDEPRKKMVPALVRIYLKSPLYGHGPDHYREELTWRTMPDRILSGKKTISAHNLLLLTLVETGLIGFLLVATGIGLGVKSAWRARWGPLFLIPLALIVPLVVVGIVSGAPHYAPAFWVAMAYALANPR
jgi:hypothetical protein